LHVLRSEAVPLIKLHLWGSRHPPTSPDGRPWTIARDLNIWNRLVTGFKPAHVNGAITVVRKLRHEWANEALRLTVFYWRRPGGFCATPFLEECIGYWLKREEREHARRGKLPPSVGQTLRGMLS
jgi:hypothetical protein